MLFFGLLWLGTWIGYSFSSIPGLPPSFPSKIFSPKVPTTTGKSIFDLNNQELCPRKLEQPPNVFMGTASDPLVVNPPSPSLSPLFSPSSPTSEDFLPKILRSLQNIFRWPQIFGRSRKGLPVTVTQPQPLVFQVWVRGHLTATLTNELQAKLMQQRLLELLSNRNLDASLIGSTLVNGTPAIVNGNRPVFTIYKEIATQLNCSSDLLAIEWSNNLRIALAKPPFTLVAAQMQMYGLVPTTEKISGLASWYGPWFDGRLTATGEIFNQNELTAAHLSLPFNTYLKVTNLNNGNEVIVRVNDRGPYVESRVLDLSRQAARCINSEVSGVAPVEAVIMQPLHPQSH